MRRLQVLGCKAGGRSRAGSWRSSLGGGVGVLQNEIARRAFAAVISLVEAIASSRLDQSRLFDPWSVTKGLRRQPIDMFDRS
jgi:hypothetical protein